MTHVPPESKAWPNAGAQGRPSPSGEQAGRVGQPVDETSAAAREPGAHEPAPPAPPVTGERAGAQGGASPARGLGQAPREQGDGGVQDQPRSPAQRTD